MSSILQRCGKIRIRINGNEMDHGWEPSNTTTQAPPKEALHSSVQPIQQKMLREQPDHDLASSWAAFRLHGAIGSLRQLQKPSSFEGNDAGSGRSGVTPTYQEYHSEQLKGSKKPNDPSFLSNTRFLLARIELTRHFFSVAKI
jgi:hypothetical protein